MLRFSSFSVGMLGGFAALIGYTVASWGRIKCARFSAFASPSAPFSGTGGAAGRSLDSRASEKKDCCGGGGRLRMDFPGTGIVTAEDEAGEVIIGEDVPLAIVYGVDGV
jgi:hypothetical protein